MDEIINIWINAIPAVLMGLFLTWALKVGKTKLKQFFRKVKLSELKKIRAKRFNYSAVTYEIVKTHCLMVLFIGLFIFYLNSLNSFVESGRHWVLGGLLISPLYIVQMYYLWQRDFTKSLIKSVAKLV
ncbi:hypothetical protein FM038_004545 [Shewanella eurypsychrophilus]|uniref:Uncharacterized protein n=1 Tax=Shewanella eurypsychrophilus TaxID=2593656 RepID=A0ABX6V4N1_9GAMM|nr:MULTISPECIES: hypothetical protein [Shewanella]QFU21485.1 hypothetical protein FS418_06125 [Shewanella sp. YLB-09]QPG56775.1 hypothetical protein FM038_004545 [Shewanella eurypsychrophilus]